MAIVYAKMDTTKTDAKITIGAYDFLSSEHDIESISITNGCYDGRAPGIGAVYSKIATIKMKNIPAIKKGQKIEISFSESGYGNWHTAGEFYVSEQPVASSDFATINAHGVLIEYGDQVVNQYRSLVNTIGNVLYYTQKQIGKYINWIYPDDFDMKTYAELMSREVMFTRKPLHYETELGGNGAENLGITIREALSGLAILYGGNVFEGTYDGDIKIQPNAIYTDKELIFGEDTYIESYKYSNKKYAINKINLSFLPYVGIEWHDPNGNLTVRTMDYNSESGDRVKDEMMVSSSDLSAYNAYDYTIECDWIGWPNEGSSYEAFNIWANSAEQWKQWDYTPGGRVTPCLVQGDLIFNAGSFEFVGYNENITPGNIINIQVGEETVNLYCGEVTWEWDGGFTTKVSCNCNVDGDGAYSSSGASSSVASSSNANSAMQNYNSINFANITFSNVKDSTISGSKFIDGSIEGSKISDSTLTGSKFKNGTIDGSKINFSTFKDGVISGTAIDTSTFKDGSISGSSFVDGTIENSKIKDSTLTGAKIADATIGIEKVNESFIKDLTAKNAFIENLTSTVAKINSLTATDAIIRNIFSNKIVSDKAILDVLQANIINAEYIKSAVADVGYITADEADLSYADITLGNIDTANIDVAKIGLLFTQVGLIDRATIVDGHITGFLDAVEINADKITAGTLIADRILLKGSESGLLYALNNLGELTSTAVDTLDGTILTQRTVTADKLVANSITANELDAEDIFANSAVIKKISTGVADIIELDADRIKSGIIDSARINTAEILASHAQFGKDYVTVDVNNESTMFTPDNIHIYNEIGGTDIQGGYIVNTNSSRKNIVPFCNYTSNDLIPGDVISVTVTYKYDIQNAKDGVKAFAYFFNSDGTINAYGKIESSKIIGSSGTETTDTFYITIPKEIVKFEFKNGYVDYAYVVFGIMNEHTGTTMYVKSASAIKVSDSIRVIGTSKMDDLVVNNLTIEKELSLKHLQLTSWLRVDGGSDFYETVCVGAQSSSYGTYIYPHGGLFVFPSSYTTEQTKINSSGIETGGYVKANTITSKASVSAQSIELSFSTPYIDFHFENSTSDYTSRIIEEASGRLKVTGSLSIGDKLIGGKWCYNDTTSYGLYWSSESVLRPISSSYKVSLGSSSCPMSSIYATTLYEGGSLLKNKYAVVKTDTGSKKGTGGWTGITINFGVTFTTIPMFNAMFTNGFTTENISVTDISTTSATIWICALDKSFTYKYRWFAVGNIA